MSLAETLSKIDHLDDDARECIEICTEAAEACEWCADECLGDEEMEACARLCRDVADLTTLHARFMARDSNYSPQLAEACAGACEECAEECGRHDDEHCQVCAEVLTECAESCRNMMSS
ncbi:four-helix bundle copper-binding protein [Haloarchaeobius litoreus]|uniref:Four-helix bundle copper-binding protein n=1 Tax=Haloarchaeobius litoreus TaxID=755306 RepID=A0ABD6DRM6_9EURY|nr:four-helix bundle copper-binding protein [Haloarchaeobius litoreus]